MCPASVGLHVMAISLAAAYRESAPVPGEVPEWFIVGALPRPAERRRAVDALVESGLWDQLDETLVIHDFADYNQTTDELERRRMAERERKRRQREREAAA